MAEPAHVTLEPWHADDLALLERANSAEMTRFLGGPELPEDLAARHAEYLQLMASGAGAMFRVEVDGEPAGHAGWWTEQHEGAPVCEVGCVVEPAWQGRGVATEALRRVIAHAIGTTGLPVVGYAAIDNEASNALCRRTGFALRGTGVFSSHDGDMAVNVWVVDAKG